MDFVIVLIRFRKLLFARQQVVEPLPLTQFEILVHLDRFERANFHANLTTHANRDVDVEHRRIELRFADVVRLLVFTLNNIDALRWAFFLADLTGHAAQTRVGIVPIVNQKRKVPVILRERISLFRILNRDQSLLVKIAARKIPQRDRHSLQNSHADHCSFNLAEIAASSQGKVEHALLARVRLMGFGDGQCPRRRCPIRERTATCPLDRAFHLTGLQ